MPAPPPYKHNRLHQLRGFCAAARTGSISRAAAALGLSQPSVSLQVQALERELGVALFDRRGGARIRLTAHGRSLYELAAPMVEAMDGLPEAFAARCGTLAPGRLDVAAGESTLLYLLPPLVNRFARECPQIDLRLLNVTGQEGLSLLRKGEVDLAFGSLMEVPDDVVFLPAQEFPPMLITPRRHPLAGRRDVTLAEIAEHPLILPPKHLTTYHNVSVVFAQHGLKPRVRAEVGGWEVIKKYVELGIGVSIVTGICLSGTERLSAVPLSRFFPHRTYGPVLRRGAYLSPQAERFLALVEARDKERKSSSG